MMSASVRRGIVAGTLVACVFLLANWPRAIMIAGTMHAAGFPFTFATWYGGERTDFQAIYFAIDFLIAAVAIIAAAVLFSRIARGGRM